MRTLVVLPTHDEAENVTHVLDGIDAHLPAADVLVVDDASTDGTPDLVRRHPGFGQRVHLLERPSKMGLASAYLEGFRAALEGNYAAVAQIDADRSHDPAVLPTMLAVAGHGIDVVIGSRYIPGAAVRGWSRRRTWLSRWGNRYAAIVLGLAINDATAGYRVYRTAALRRLDLAAISSDGYVFQIEMTYRAVAAGMSVVEVPIVFRDRVAGHSKMSSHIVGEAFTRVTWWGLSDLFTLRRRHRAYGE